MMGECVKCGEHGYVMPLHDERGGPLFCFMCAGAWHAEHGPRRRARRVVIKALRAYEAAGGHIFGKDFDELILAASGFSAFTGFEADTDFSDLTSELLAATIALTHPDKHPVERRAEANRVTQELQALKPFVFPAPEPEPEPELEAKSGDDSFKHHAVDLDETSQPAYPCEDCRDTIPSFYCNPCKAQWEKEQEKEREREEEERKRKNACARARYKASKRFRDLHAKPAVCEMCGNAFKSKRSDAKYCSAACRQRAYLKREGKASNSKPLGSEEIERAVTSAFTDNPDGAFSTDDLCDQIYLGLNRVERKHRAAVIAIAKKVCGRLGENWDWMRSESRGGMLVFWNRVSVTSYALARLKSDFIYHGDTEEELKAEISPGGRYHEYVVQGGAWWQHCQEDIAALKRAPANPAQGGSG
jgi:hypothetical protein